MRHPHIHLFMHTHIRIYVDTISPYNVMNYENPKSVHFLDTSRAQVLAMNIPQSTGPVYATIAKDPTFSSLNLQQI